MVICSKHDWEVQIFWKLKQGVSLEKRLTSTAIHSLRILHFLSGCYCSDCSEGVELQAARRSRNAANVIVEVDAG